MVSGILIYGSLLLFYSANNNWATPLVLSPSQTKVLSTRAQTAALESNIQKLKSEILETEYAFYSKLDSVNKIDTLISKLNKSTNAEYTSIIESNAVIENLLQNKREDILKLNSLLQETSKIYQFTDKELEAGLITKDQSIGRKTEIQERINAVTEATLTYTTLLNQIDSQKRLAQSLKGSNTSILGFQTANQLVTLSVTSNQLKAEIVVAEQLINNLNKTLKEQEKLLKVAKESAYYEAADGEIVVAFIPYDNLNNSYIGAYVYDCYLQIIFCRKVGKIVKEYAAEEYAKHPLFKTDLRGNVVRLDLTDNASKISSVIFSNVKPLGI